MKIVKVLAATAAGTIATAIILLIGIQQWRLSGAPEKAALLARAANFDGEILRDEWGVPHVFGTRDADAAFALGYAHSEDDFATIQGVTMAMRGRLAEIQGKAAAPGDYLVRLMRIWPTVRAGYVTRLPQEVRDLLEAYADGINLYAAHHEDRVAPGLLPVTGEDIAAGFAFKMPLFYGFDQTLKRLLAPPAGSPPQIGSNGLAIAPVRSADGATRLLVNSHQPYSGPVAWYEAVVQSKQGWHVAGGFFPGSPFMLHGHNEHLGWANTVNKPNLVDIYSLTINPDNPNQYRLDGGWRDFERSTAWLWVKLIGPLAIPVPKEVLWSAHGPAVRTDHGTFALRYAGMGEMRQPLQYYRLDKAANLAEWQDAMRLQAIPSLNFIYADEKGTIGYLYNGSFPVRSAGYDGGAIENGEHSDLIWQDHLPFEKLPQIWNPPSGLLFNSNNTPFHATLPADDLDPQRFPAEMGIQINMTNRAQRVLETFGQDRAITEEAFRRYKFDVAYSENSAMVKTVGLLAALDIKGDERLAAAQKLLRQWDRRADAQDRSAALPLLAATPLVEASEAGIAGPSPRAALENAVSILEKHFGRLDPEWGEVCRIRRGIVDMPLDGAHDTYRAADGPIGKDGRIAADTGDTFIMFVIWDRAGKLHSESIHQFGSATLDAASPHYADQTPLFAAMKTKPVWFDRADLEPHIAARYRPADRNG